MSSPRNAAASYFKAVGDGIRDALPAGETTADAFTETSYRALSETPCPEGLDQHAIAEWVLESDALPRQVNFDSRFGQPPLTVYADERFYVEALYWFPSRTSIHSHGFSGAFRVLAGRSLHASYSFTARRSLDDGLRTGVLETKRLEWLAPGEVKPILDHERFVHAVAHLGFPSITLVARTGGIGSPPQWEYSRSGLAWQPFRRKEVVRRKLELLAAVRETSETRFAAALRKLFAQETSHAFSLLYRLSNADWWSEDARAEINALAESRFGAAFKDALIGALEEERRQQNIWGGWTHLKRSEDLVSVALAEMFPSQDARAAAVQSARPNARPPETVARWAAEVGAEADAGHNRSAA